VVRVHHLAVWVIAWTLVVGLVAGCDGSKSSSDQSLSAAPSNASDDESFQPTDDDRAAIRAVLEARATAVSEGYRDAFMATVDTVNGDLVHQQQLLFDNLQKLPVTEIGYTVDDGAGFVAAEVEGDDPVFRPRVFEQVRLDIDSLPVTNILENTFVRRDGTWLLGAESKPGEHETDHESQSRPWAGAIPIAVARSGRLLVVVDRRRNDVGRALAREMVGYIRFAARALGVDPSYDVLVDATTVGDPIGVSSVDSEQAAAATITVTHFGVDDEEDPDYAGTRIKVNPDRADRVVSDTQVMRHELTHYLTVRRLEATPIWVTEGLAEWVSTAPSSLDDLVITDPSVIDTALNAPKRLPTDGRWGQDPTTDYLVARAAMSRVVETFGMAKVFEMGRAYARVPGDDADQKTDRVLRRVLGITEAQLVTATWDGLETLRRE
jgi:hypothetical protein